MIFINNLSKSYGNRILFEKFNLTIDRGEKIGLIGPNGAGKSTLFSVILGKLEQSTGHIQINKGVRIGYLPQEVSFTSGFSVLSVLTEGDESIIGLKKEKDELEKKNMAHSARYAKIMHDLEFLGVFGLEHKAKKILMGLGFKERDFNRPVESLSGGWQMRTLLAKLLVLPYDVLLLDEPMNHLDLAAAIWFKNYLAKLRVAFVIISHDKAFLNEVTNYTLVLENTRIAKVKGNYEHYEKIQDEKRIFLQKQFNEQEKKKKQLKNFISRFHAQPNKASQVRAKKRMMDKMQEIVLPASRRQSMRKFHFPQSKKSGYCVMDLKGASKSYGDTQVYKDFDFEIIRQEKAVLVGENGAGKSTLLKILAGITDVDKGERRLGHNVDIGYFSQRRLDVLNSSSTVFDEAYSVSEGRLSGEDIRTILGAFLFCGDDVGKKISVLSGGEKSRLILAKLLINPPNFLLLDEPTTHLDVDSVDALIKALQEFEGTLIFISHDIYFVRSIANTVFEVKEGNVRKFSGNFDYYWQKRSDKLKAVTAEVKPSAHKPKAPNFRVDKQAMSEEELKEYNAKLSKRIRKLRREKQTLEAEHYAKSRTLSNPHSFHLRHTIEEYTSRLKKIEERTTEIDAQIVKFKEKFL